MNIQNVPSATERIPKNRPCLLYPSPLLASNSLPTYYIPLHCWHPTLCLLTISLSTIGIQLFACLLYSSPLLASNSLPAYYIPLHCWHPTLCLPTISLSTVGIQLFACLLYPSPLLASNSLPAYYIPLHCWLSTLGIQTFPRGWECEGNIFRIPLILSTN